MSTLNRWAADRRARDEQYQIERERHTLQQEARRLEDERRVLHQQHEYQEALAQDEFGELVAERDELADQLRTVLDALKEVEWEGDWQQCPWCLALEEDGHAPDCQRQAAIAAVEGE